MFARHALIKYAHSATTKELQLLVILSPTSPIAVLPFYPLGTSVSQTLALSISTVSKLLIYCALRPTQPPIFSGTGIE